MKFKFFIFALIITAFLSSNINSDNTIKEGSKAPAIERISGEKENLNDGKYRLINFWSPKNPESRIANKTYSDLVEKKPDLKVEFISISTDSDDLLSDEVRKYDGADKSGKYYSYSELNRRVFKDYKVTDSPSAFLISPEGKIIGVNNSIKSILQ